MAKAKIVRVGNDLQVMVKEYNRIFRLSDLYGFMKWDMKYNSIESLEERLKSIWGYEIVDTLK